MTPEDKLAALFAAEAPPARDHIFQAAVAERIARRRAWATVGAMTPWAVAAASALWGLRPVIEPLSASLGEALAPAGAMLVMAAMTAVAGAWMTRRFGSR
jgi:hypothetical protein